MKKLISILLIAVMAVTVMAGVAGCKKDASLSVCVGPEPTTIDPALNSTVDGATLIIHSFSGLVGWRMNDEGILELYGDCAKELPTATETEDGKFQYVFELRDGLKWNDGTDLTAHDFEFAWKRAVSVELGADYGYMFDVVDGYYDVIDEEPGGELNVTASEDGKTLTVILPVDVPYFMELCAFPTYMPVKESLVGDEAWATEASTYIGNGPYKMMSWDHGSTIVMEKNEYYHDKDLVTMEKITFYLSDDDGAQLANFKNGDWLLIDTVPSNEIQALKTDYPDEFKITGQLGTYYACWNINKDLLPATSTLTGNERVQAMEEIRKALSLLLDRNYIVESIAQGGELPASSYVAMGLIEPDGEEFYKKAGHNTGYIGYYDTSREAFEGNAASALEVLKQYYNFDEATQKFTDFPSFEYIYNPGSAHQGIAEYMQQAFGVYGITMTIASQEWNTFTETRKNGEYAFARNGWLGDYNDPISFLDMWLSGSGNNDIQYGKGDNENVAYYSVDATSLGYSLKVTNGTWAETYDKIIGLVKAEKDQQKRMDLMHLAEDLLMQTGGIVPIYYYVDLFMVSTRLQGVYASPLGYKYFMYSTIVD